MAFFYGFLGILGTIALFLLKGLVNAWIDWLVSNLMLMLLVISLVGGVVLAIYHNVQEASTESQDSP